MSERFRRDRRGLPERIYHARGDLNLPNGICLKVVDTFRFIEVTI